MKRWSERGVLLAVVAGGWLFPAIGCGGETDTRTDSNESSESDSSTPAGRPGGMANAGSSAKAGSGATPSASDDAGPQRASGGAGSSAADSGGSGASGSSGAGGKDASPSSAGGGGTSGDSAAAGGAAAGTSGSAAGSGGASNMAPAGEATFTAIYTEILTKGATGNCMFAACHGGEPDPAVNGGLQIKAGDKAGAYKNLVNAKSPGMVCGGKTYVIPGDSAGSLLVQKLADAPPCGAKMPIGSPLTAAQIAQIAKWVDDGAQDN